MRVDVEMTSSASSSTWSGGGTNYVVQVNNGNLYMVYADANSDVVFVKSTNKGLTWSNVTVLYTGTVRAISVWYDRWSNISAGLIHIAYTEDDTDDTRYRTINTESSDALSTETVVFAGATTASGGRLSIARARGGNVYVNTTIDAGAEGGFFRLPNANVPNGAWDAARANPEALATTDQIILAPGFAADNQDMLAIFWDASAEEISRYVYDDSANSWAETSIATTMTDQVSTAAFPNFAIAVDLTNSRLILVAWSAVDAANADLRCWTITESAITETSTNVVLNSTDDQGLCAIHLDTVTAYWYVFYGGASAGGETYSTAIKIYYKVSQDSGATWGAETTLTSVVRDTQGLWCTPRGAGWWVAAVWNNTVNDNIVCSVEIPRQRARAQIGL